MPKIREPKRLTTFVTPEPFDRLYEAADAVTLDPIRSPEIDRAAWWRALLTFLVVHGRRVGESLALRWDEVDLEAGVAIMRAEDGKGNRDEAIALHPDVIDHLRAIRWTDPRVFPFDWCDNALWSEYDRIWAAAGMMRQKGKAFHDLRRTMGTENATRLAPVVLQSMMGHADFQTTNKFYINRDAHQAAAVASLFVPESVRRAAQHGNNMDETRSEGPENDVNPRN